MSPAQQPSCLERLPPEVFLEIARHVADLDVRLILASRFILDNAATLTTRTAPVPKTACCCASVPGAWGRQATQCFRDAPAVSSSFTALLGLSRNLRRALMLEPSFWAMVPILQPLFLPDSLNGAGTKYPLRLVAPAGLCLCVFEMILPRIRYAQELVATFPSFHPTQELFTSEMILSTFQEFGVPRLKEVTLKFDPSIERAPPKLVALLMPDLRVCQVANSVFVAYGGKLTVLQVACETQHFTWAFCDMIALLQRCQSLEKLVLITALREALPSERRSWRSRPPSLELPYLSLFLLRADYSVMHDVLEAFTPPFGCSTLLELLTETFPREARSGGRDLCVKNIRDEVNLFFKTLFRPISSPYIRTSSWSIASLEYRALASDIEKWPEFIRITFATSIAQALAANDDTTLIPRCSFTLRNPWNKTWSHRGAGNPPVFGMPHSNTLEGFLQGCAVSPLSDVTTVSITVGGTSLWPKGSFACLFQSAKSVRELVVFGIYADAEPFRDLLTYLNHTRGLETRLCRVRFPDWSAADDTFVTVGLEWNARFSGSGKREHIEWTR